jgi:hypothetical protein
LDCPPGIPTDEWGRLKDFLASADDLVWADFVRAFEWSTGAPDSPALRPQIKERLERDLGLGAEVGAEGAYQQLFAVVFDRLCQPGLKRLTRADLLEVLQQGPVGAVRTRVAQLTVFHAALTGRVDELAQQMISTRRGIHRYRDPSSGAY